MIQLQSLITTFDSTNTASIFSGNPDNIRTLVHLLDTIPRSASGLIFIDPPGYRYLSWSSLNHLAAHGKNWQNEKLDLLILFPLEMALLRNFQRPECEKSITQFFGNRRWEDFKRQSQVQKLAAGDLKTQLIELFKTGLFELGYRYVEDFRPAAPTPEPYYHIIYASDRASRLKYIQEAWGQSRFLKCELLYSERTKIKRKKRVS